jgi:hypothetical protein
MAIISLNNVNQLIVVMVKCGVLVVVRTGFLNIIRTRFSFKGLSTTTLTRMRGVVKVPRILNHGNRRM